MGHPQADTVAVNEGPADVGAIVLLASQKALKTTEVGGDGGQCGGRETAVGGGVVEIVGDMAVHGAAVWVLKKGRGVGVTEAARGVPAVRNTPWLCSVWKRSGD